MSVSAFTTFHVILSLAGIASGFVVLSAMLGSRHLPRWTILFLATTILTSLSGYLFARDHILPSHVVGALSLVVLAATVYALYGRRLHGSWRAIYVIGSALALYFNVFVLVVQSFQKIRSLTALAPTQSEPPFVIVQALVLVAVVVLGYRAVRGFRPALDGIAARPA
jgi:hypothetical protein